MDHAKNKVFKLIGKAQHYAWGGHSFIASLLGHPNKPIAEYWMGAHHNASSEILFNDGKTAKLNEYIGKFPLETLGEPVFEKFGKLPYLLKILDVKDMLSIQVHPSKENAEIEFAKEQASGIAVDAPNRNYKDNNHKPELALALGEFWLLHGFKSEQKLKSTLQNVYELKPLLTVFESGGYYELYRVVMEMDQQVVNQMLQPLLDKIMTAYQKNQLEKTDEHFWAARAALTYNQPDKIDRGIFSIYFFNLLKLNPGEAIFQEAGLPHAYLEGQNVEIMSNSDNVLRGGLTPKHIDVKELLKHIKFEETIPRIIYEKKLDDHVWSYPTTATDFELSKIELKKNEHASVISESAEIFFVMKGNVEIKEQAHRLTLSKGEAFVSFHASGFDIDASDNALLYVASVPFPQP
jgi:mannose-6-phosphate isomerase